MNGEQLQRALVPGCSCPSTTDEVRASLEGITLEPSCPVHQADAIAELKAHREREKAEAELTRRRAVHDNLRQQVDDETAVETQVSAGDPLQAMLEDALRFGRPGLALNASADEIAEGLGMDTTTTTEG